MTPQWLQEAVAACKEPSSPGFPRMMDRVWTLLVHVEPIEKITPEKVKSWLLSAGARVEHSSFERHMHGCMAAHGDIGFIFCDSTDAPHVQRFTLAHELGHYVLEHLLPRERTRQALGEGGLPIFDGEREPAPADALYSILGGGFLQPESYMDRNAQGEPASGAVDEAEYRADRVAYELLAPAGHVLPRMKGLSRKEAVALLRGDYGLPRAKARAYARLLLGSEHKGFSIREYLGEEEEE